MAAEPSSGASAAHPHRAEGTDNGDPFEACFLKDGTPMVGRTWPIERMSHDMLNRRSQPRKKSSTPATLASGSTETPATILDISARGARIQVANNVFLSHECFLKSPNFLAGMPSKTVWRRRSEIGLLFKTVLQERSPTPQRAGAPPAKFGRR